MPNLIRSIWLWVLSVFFTTALLLSTATSAVIISSDFAYDGHNQRSTAYDEGHASPVFDYDSAAVRVAGKKEIGAAEVGGLFADFSKLLAARSGEILGPAGNGTGSVPHKHTFY
jgi:hypothetical protein